MKRPDAAAFEKVGPCSQPAAKGFRNANTVKVNRSRDAAAAGLPPELVDDLLRQHCHGMWVDSDDDQQDEKKSSQTSSLKCAIKEQPSGGGPGGKTLHRPLAQASPTCGVTDEGPTQKKQKVRASEALSSAQETGYLQLKSSDTPTQRHSMAVHANVAPARVLPPTPWQNSEKRRSHQRESKAKRQAKDLRKWSNMRACALRPILKSAPAGGQCPTKISCATAENGEVSRSLMTHNGLRDLSFVADPEDANFVPLAAQAEKRDDKHRKDQAEPAKDAKKEFDETVQDIRNMAATKTQKMPLPELLARKKATAAVIEARQAEEKALGVRSHIDTQGSIQHASRNRSKLMAMKARRKHLRDTFKHAGKLGSSASSGGKT